MLEHWPKNELADDALLGNMSQPGWYKANIPFLAVPDQAIVYEGDNAHVWLANPVEKTLALRQITVGREIDGTVQVLAGLKPGDAVVTSGAVFIDRAAAGD